MIRFFRTLFFIVPIVIGMLPAFAQTGARPSIDNYPSKPIKFIVPYSPGGGNDILARLFAQKLTESMGQPVVVENRAGAGATIGTAFVAKAPPDGYTILMVTPPFVMAPALYPNLPYDTLKDLVPVTEIGWAPQMLVVHPSVPAKSVAELLALAREKSMLLSAATTGSATTPHLAAAMFNYMGKIDLLMVPYKGSAQGTNDLIAGHVKLMFNAMPSTLPYVKNGQLRALGVTSAKRSPLAPDVPTVAETLPGFEIVTWYGVVAPASMPPSIIARLYAEFSKAGQLSDIKKQLLDMGMVGQFTDPKTFGALIKSEMTKWAEVIRVTDVKAE